MNHFNDEQLIDHYYGESERPAAISSHLRECGDCARAYAALVHDLSEIAPITPPARSADYGTQVWQSIRNSAAVYEPQKKQSRWLNFNLLKPLSFAAAALVLISAAFFAGRQWEHRKGQPPANVATAANNNPPAKERVVILVLGDHLDRSERLLVQLRHGDTSAPMQAEARDLLSANRLYRESAAQAGDPALNAALDHLERVLVEIANQPDGLTPARLNELQQQMNTDGLLFEVRVLRTRVNDLNQSDHQNANQPGKQDKSAGSTGVSI